MKKSKLFLSSILGLLLLSSCSFNLFGSSGGALKSKGSVWDADMMEQNAEVYSLEEEIGKYRKINDYTYSKIHSTSYYGEGLIIVENNYEKLGFYSLFNSEYIDFQHNKADLTYEVYTGLPIGFVLKLADSLYEKTDIIDSFGNVLFSYNSYYYSDSINLNFNHINDIYYLKLNVSKYNSLYGSWDYNEYYFEYNKNGIATPIETDPDLMSEGEEVNDDYEFGDLVDEEIYSVPLDDFGLEGYYMTMIGSGYYQVISVYNDKNVKTASFTYNIETMDQGIIAGGKALIQYKYELPDDAVEYDLYDGSSKYGFELVSLDLKTGKQTKVKSSYIILDGDPIKDKDGVYSYAVVSLGVISKNKTIKVIEQWIIDGSGKLYDHLEEMSPFSLYKVGDNYYDETAKALYDAQAKRIASFSGLSYVSVIQGKYLLGLLNGYHGLMDSDGRVLIPFEYTNIDYNFVGDYALARKGSEIYRINLVSGTTTLLGTNPIQLEGGVYSVQDSEKITIFDAESTLLIHVFEGESFNTNTSYRYISVTGKTYITLVVQEETDAVFGVYGYYYQMYAFVR